MHDDSSLETCISRRLTKRPLKTLRSPFDKLRVTGGALQNVKDYPFVLSLSKHVVATGRGFWGIYQRLLRGIGTSAAIGAPPSISVGQTVHCQLYPVRDRELMVHRPPDRDDPTPHSRAFS